MKWPWNAQTLDPNSDYFEPDTGRHSVPTRLTGQSLQNFFLTGKFFEGRTTQFIEKPLTIRDDRVNVPNFKSMVELHMADGDVAFAMDLHTAVIAGRGFHIEASKPMIADKATDFARDFGMADFGSISVMESLGYGNSLYKYKEPGNFIDIEHLPLSEWVSMRYENKTVVEYEFQDELVPAYQMLHLKWRIINASPIGHGLMAPLIEEREYEVKRGKETEIRFRKSIKELKPEMQDIARMIMQKYVPRNWININGQGPKDTIASKFMAKLGVLEPTQDIVSPVDSTITPLNQNIRSIDWESWEKLFRNEMITTLENPAIRIFTEPGFTKANADAALDAVKLLLNGFATYLAAVIEDTIIRPWYENEPWITADGDRLPWREAGIKFVWGPLEVPEFEMADLTNMANLTTSGFPVIKPTEYRRIARETFQWNLDEDDDVALPNAATDAAAASAAQQIEALKLQLADKGILDTEKQKVINKIMEKISKL